MRRRSADTPRSLPKSVSTEPSLPEGIYAYDIRSGEGNDFGTIEPCVTVNHTGTILTRQPIEMGPEGYIEIDMDGDDGLIDAMTYDEWIAQPETTC